MSEVIPLATWARLTLCRWGARPTGRRLFGVQALPSPEQRVGSGVAVVLRVPQPILASYHRAAISRETFIRELRAHLAVLEARKQLDPGVLAFAPSWSAWATSNVVAMHGDVVYCACDPRQPEHEPACVLPYLPPYLIRSGWRVLLDGRSLIQVDAWRCESCGNTGTDFYYDSGDKPGEGTERCVRCNSAALAGAGMALVWEDSGEPYDTPR
jgi:hypothetical protein